MILYTINGVYPDKTFNFSITPTNVGLAASVHSHTISDIQALSDALSAKSPSTHTHQNMFVLYSNNSIISGNVTIQSSGIQISNQNKTIILSYTPTSTATFDSVVNAASTNTLIHFNTGTYASQDNSFVSLCSGCVVSENTLVNSARMITNGTDTLTKMLIYENGTATQVWPPECVKLRIETNYDDSLSSRAHEGDVYPIPVALYSGLTDKPLKVTITPYPADAEWTLTATGITLTPELAAVHKGVQTLELLIAQPLMSGYIYKSITVSPALGSCPTITAKLYILYYGESTIDPYISWNFDSETAPLEDTIQSIAMSPCTVESTLNSLATPAFATSWNGTNAFSAPNAPDATYPWWYSANLSNVINTKNKGFSFNFYCRNWYSGYIGFRTATGGTADQQAGKLFGVKFSYAQPTPFTPFSAMKPGNELRPATTAGQRLSTNKWHSLCMTFSAPVDISTDSRFSYDGTVLTFADGYCEQTQTIANPTARCWRVCKFFIDGIQFSSMATSTASFDNAVFADSEGLFYISHDNASRNDTSLPLLDNISLYNYELTAGSVATLATEVGAYNSDADTDGGSSSAKPAKFDVNPRSRTLPADLSTIPLTCNMKSFIIDDHTIAIATHWRDFFIARFTDEYPYMPQGEQNYRNGYIQDYVHTFYYQYGTWELYGTYQPRIVDAMDLVTNYTVDSNAVELVGRWQNSTGIMHYADFYDGTTLVDTDCADIVHFAYLKLSTPMEEGSTHTIVWNGNTTTVTYSKDHYASSIKVNQLGYSPTAGRKYAYFGSWLGTGGPYIHTLSDLTFYLVTTGTTPTTAFTGTMSLKTTADTHTQDGTTYKLNGEKTYVLDFSEFSTPGEYQIYIPHVGFSHKFIIGNQAYGEAFYLHSRGLFHHRSGCDKICSPYTNWTYGGPGHNQTWESNFICDDDDYGKCVTNTNATYSGLFGGKQFAMIPNNTTGKLFRDVQGGWYDAADFDRRPYHFIVVEDLLEAYLRFPENFTDSQLDIPESGNEIPDILDEAMWFLDCLRRGQRNGGIAAWIESTGHEKGWPWESTYKYYIGSPNRQDSLRYAAAAARLVRCLRTVGTEPALKKAAIFADSALAAYKFGIDPNNATHLQFSQKSNGVTYDFTYDEPSADADFYTIASSAAMYMMTKDGTYLKNITDELWTNYFNVLSTDENTYTTKTCTEFLYDLTLEMPEQCAALKEFTLRKAQQWYDYQELQTYHEMNWAPNHSFFKYTGWGIGHPETRGRFFIHAWKLTGAVKWRDAAYLIMDNVMGCNALGRTLTTGLGKVAPIHHLDHWLPQAEVRWHKFEPVPGISPYHFTGEKSGTVTPYGYCLYKQSRSDMSYPGITLNILPGGYSTTIANSRGSVAAYLQTHWPIWRESFILEDYYVSQDEFTVSETISGKVFMCGCLMGSGVIPDASWKARTPSTDRYAPEGLIYLP